MPVLSPHLSSYWLHLVTPVLRTEAVARDERLRALVPLALTSFDVAARAAFAPRERRAA